jgi:hypothetical protein
MIVVAPEGLIVPRNTLPNGCNKCSDGRHLLRLAEMHQRIATNEEADTSERCALIQRVLFVRLIRV